MISHFRPNIQNDPTGEEAGRQLKAKLDKRAVAEAQLQAVLDAGRAAATNGWAVYRRWEGGLSAPDFERIRPHLDALAKAATEADGGKT